MFWSTFAFSTFAQFGLVGTNQLDFAARANGASFGFDALKARSFVVLAMLPALAISLSDGGARERLDPVDGEALILRRHRDGEIRAAEERGHELARGVARHRDRPRPPARAPGCRASRRGRTATPSRCRRTIRPCPSRRRAPAAGSPRRSSCSPASATSRSTRPGSAPRVPSGSSATPSTCRPSEPRSSRRSRRRRTSRSTSTYRGSRRPSSRCPSRTSSSASSRRPRTARGSWAST